MNQLLECILEKKPFVVWNPYHDNDGLSKEEFLALVKLSKYQLIEFDGDWVTAYQARVKLIEINDLSKYLQEARERNLHICSALLEDEIEKSRCLKIVYL